jgi:hypothetical protein
MDTSFETTRLDLQGTRLHYESEWTEVQHTLHILTFSFVAIRPSTPYRPIH